MVSLSTDRQCFSLPAHFHPPSPQKKTHIHTHTQAYLLFPFLLVKIFTMPKCQGNGTHIEVKGRQQRKKRLLSNTKRRGTLERRGKEALPDRKRGKSTLDTRRRRRRLRRNSPGLQAAHPWRPRHQMCVRRLLQRERERETFGNKHSR